MAGFDNLRQEAMRRVKEMQQNASSQDNNSKRQNRNDGRGSFSPQGGSDYSSQKTPDTRNSGSFPSQPANHQNSFQNSPQEGFQSQQHQSSPAKSIDLQALAEGFSGEDVKAAKTGGEILDACFHDKEKSLILILLLLLSSDNADTGLLLALMYLLI